MSPLDPMPGYRAIVVMNMPKKVNDFITYSVSKHDTMAANPRYASLAAKLTTLETDNTQLKKSQTGYKSVPPTVSRAVRDTDFSKCRVDVKVLAGSVQEMADSDPVNAEAIITEASFGVKKIPIPQKQKNEVMDGPESGSVIILSEGKGAHNYRQSTDGVTWTNLTGSKNSRKIVRGLTVAKLYYFQTSLALIDGEEGEWSQTLSIVVR